MASGAKSNAEEVKAKRKKWQDILESEKAAKIYKKWLDTEEAELNCLKLGAIDIAATGLGRLKKNSWIKWKQQLKTWQKRKRRHFCKS